MRKDWSPSELVTLRRMLGAKKTHAEIARELNRSASSVKNKANTQAAFADQPRQVSC
jgi:hypothetical protein